VADFRRTLLAAFPDQITGRLAGPAGGRHSQLGPCVPVTGVYSVPRGDGRRRVIREAEEVPRRVAHGSYRAAQKSDGAWRSF
jgi:hypothetical protein